MDKMREQIGAFERNAEEIKRALSQMQGNRGMQNITVLTANAGGAVVALMALIAAFLCGLVVALGISVIDHGRKIDRLQDHLTAVYMMAPHLKPEETP